MLRLENTIFQAFIDHYTTAKTRESYTDSIIRSIKIKDGVIDALVQEKEKYEVSILYNHEKVIRAKCTCSFLQAGHCKHIVNVLVHADEQLLFYEETDTVVSKINGFFVFEKTQLLDLDGFEIDALATKPLHTHTSYGNIQVLKAKITANDLSGIVRQGYQSEYAFQITQRSEDVLLKCSCDSTLKKPCVHLHTVLHDILLSKELQLPFKQDVRQQLLEKKAVAMGLSNIEDLDAFFDIQVEHLRLFIQPKFQILSLDEQSTTKWKEQLLPAFNFPSNANIPTIKEFLLVSESTFEDRLVFQLMQAPLSKAGDIKSPITPASLQTALQQESEPNVFQFYWALIQQQLKEQTETPTNQQKTIKAILKNPLQLDCYFNEQALYGNNKITTKSLDLIHCKIVPANAKIQVEQKNDFYTMVYFVEIENLWIESRNLHLVGEQFIRRGNELLYIDNEAVLRVFKFFQENKHELFIHQSQFSHFQDTFLHVLENSITVHYTFVKPAPAKLVKQQALNVITEHLVYLSESEDYILITPVMRYGEIEIPILSKRTVYTENPAGGLYSVDRDEAAERRFIRTIQHHHSDFLEQNETDFYYLHKQEFLDNGWFIEAFDDWRTQNISILGFNQLKNNRLNANKMKVNTVVKSGIDWFDVEAKVSFGSQDVGLKEIQKAVLNKSRYVLLGDGTQGLLPEEWIQHFGHYFRNGEIDGNWLRVHKSNFQVIDDLFEQEILSKEVRNELELYRERLMNFHSIRAVEKPTRLKATLRDYQKEGLNWLHFLDEFGFGGCLADDMGLGKTVQVIAYILSQIEQGKTGTNLIVVPTSLLFNWQQELAKFAPDMTYLTLYGADREVQKIDFSSVELILTTYGTLLSDIEQLRKFRFNLIVLDESQAIKNPQSKRYKAVRLLNGRQRLVLTGTPIENNTFDLYAQLSFAMPGLFGSAKRFADDYSTPIDKFQDMQRAKELQRKIHPFVLRRTKAQVATELPEKTEMLVFCEMGTEQRRVYDTYKKEFQKYLSKMDDQEVRTSSMHILQGLTKLRQICNSPILLSDDAYYGDQSAKLDELMEQIDGKIGEHKLLIFSQFVGMLELIKERLEAKGIAYAYLTGKTKDRQEQVELFQEEDQVRVFLISLKAGGTGLNLTKADYVFIVDPWWNPAVENQAIDRAYRIGQEQKVVAIRLITPDTIEEKILELQARKRDLAQDLIHTDTQLLKQLSKGELMNLLQ